MTGPVLCTCIEGGSGQRDECLQEVCVGYSQGASLGLKARCLCLGEGEGHLGLRLQTYLQVAVTVPGALALRGICRRKLHASHINMSLGSWLFYGS